MTKYPLSLDFSPSRALLIFGSKFSFEADNSLPLGEGVRLNHCSICSIDSDRLFSEVVRPKPLIAFAKTVKR